jgi:hypothetical protein
VEGGKRGKLEIIGQKAECGSELIRYSGEKGPSEIVAFSEFHGVNIARRIEAAFQA